jgi:hypothetical protein
LFFNVDENFSVSGKSLLEFDIADTIPDWGCHRVSLALCFSGASLRDLKRVELLSTGYRLDW